MPSDIDTGSQLVITSVGGAENGGMTNSEVPLIVGRADPFATVDVYDSATLLGVVSANGQGGWSLQLSTPLFEGIHDFSAVQVTKEGAHHATDYFAITVDAIEYSTLANDSVHDTPPPANGDTEGTASTFPANLFKVRHSQNQAVDGPETRTHILPDPDSLSPAGLTDPLQSHVRLTTTHADNGKGFNMVALSGHHLALDVSALPVKGTATQPGAIGGFDLGGHHNALTLSVADVLHLGEQNLFIDDGKQQVLVKGREGDSLHLTNSHGAGLSEGNWEHHGTTNVDGVSCNVVEHSSTHTELLVHQAVQIALH